MKKMIVIVSLFQVIGWASAQAESPKYVLKNNLCYEVGDDGKEVLLTAGHALRACLGLTAKQREDMVQAHFDWEKQVATQEVVEPKKETGSLWVVECINGSRVSNEFVHGKGAESTGGSSFKFEGQLVQPDLFSIHYANPRHQTSTHANMLKALNIKDQAVSCKGRNFYGLAYFGKGFTQMHCESGRVVKIDTAKMAKRFYWAFTQQNQPPRSSVDAMLAADPACHYYVNPESFAIAQQHKFTFDFSNQTQQ